MGAANTGLNGPHGLTPPQIVLELDKFIVGQKAAKRAVAIALRNRWRSVGYSCSIERWSLV